MGYRVHLWATMWLVGLLWALTGCTSGPAPATATPAPTAVATASPVPTSTARVASTPVAQATPAASPTVPARPAATPAATPPATQALEPGWTLAENAAQGIAIGIPNTWRQIGDERDIDAMLREFGAANPQLADLLANISPSDYSLMALDYVPSGEEDFYRNLNVNQEPASPRDTLDSVAGPYARAMEQQLPGVIAPITQTRVSLPAGEALQIRYRWQISGGGQSTATLSGTQYLFIRGGQFYFLTFTAGASDAEAKPLFEKMAATFRFTK